MKMHMLRPRTLAPVAISALLLCVMTQVFAQANPGDIVVQRRVNPRDAFTPTPRTSNPVAVSVPTFPATSFEPTMAAAVSDLDLVNAHGSNGLSVLTAKGNDAGLQAVTKMLSGNGTGNNIALGASAMTQQNTGLGATISQSISGALAPLGAMK